MLWHLSSCDLSYIFYILTYHSSITSFFVSIHCTLFDYLPLFLSLRSVLASGM